MTLPANAEHQERATVPKRDIIFLNCQDGRHRWVFAGCRACCCEIVDEDNVLVSGECSIPVFCCADCGDYDYGDNDEAVMTRSQCEDAPAPSAPLFAMQR